MEKEIAKVHRRLRRSKLAIYVIIAFVALLTYLLIVVSRELASVQTSDSQAAYNIGNRNRSGDVPDVPFSPNCRVESFQYRDRCLPDNATDLNRWRIDPGETWYSASFECSWPGGRNLFEVNDVVYCRNDSRWQTNFGFYCQIPCRGIGVGDSCTRFTSESLCDQNRVGNGYKGEDCGWFQCANKCLTKGSPYELVCPRQIGI